MIAPVETWVVETGSPFQEARQTRPAVVMLAVSDSGSGSGVSFFASVSSTLRPETSPPTAIATATMANATPVFRGRAIRHRAAIFGASFHPRAKPTMPPLNQWIAFAAEDVETDRDRCLLRTLGLGADDQHAGFAGRSLPTHGHPDARRNATRAAVVSVTQTHRSA